MGSRRPSPTSSLIRMTNSWVRPTANAGTIILLLWVLAWVRRSSAFCFMISPVGFVQPIVVGRLKNQYVAWVRRLRIAENGHIGAAKITAEEHGGPIAPDRVFHPNGRRSQDMAGVVKGCRDAWGNLEHVSVPRPLESSD